MKEVERKPLSPQLWGNRSSGGPTRNQAKNRSRTQRAGGPRPYTVRTFGLFRPLDGESCATMAINIAGRIRAYRKRRTIKSYLTRIGPLLAQRYGKSELYTPKQVKEAAKEAGLPTDDLCYALSVFCGQEAFDAYHVGLGEECSYWQTRAEVAEHLFHGNVSFTSHDVIDVAASHSGGDQWGGHDSGGGDAGHHH